MVLRVARAVLHRHDGDRRAGAKSDGGVFRLAAATGEASHYRSGLGVFSGRPDHLSYCRTGCRRTETGIARLREESSCEPPQRDSKSSSWTNLPHSTTCTAVPCSAAMGWGFREGVLAPFPKAASISGPIRSPLHVIAFPA